MHRLKAQHDYPFGVGFITWSLAKQPHLLDLALSAKPKAVWLSFGDPGPFVGKIKGSGALVVCQVQSARMAEDAVQKGADVIVAQGAEAGGHGVSRGTFALVPDVVDAVGAKVPVVAAGGVGDGRGLAAALMLGASGVVLGTRLYATVEAAGSEAAKSRIVQANGDETIRSIIFDISRRNVWPTPFTGRCLMNRHAQHWTGREVELMRELHIEGERYATARANDDFEIAAVIAGEVVRIDSRRSQNWRSHPPNGWRSALPIGTARFGREMSLARCGRLGAASDDLPPASMPGSASRAGYWSENGSRSAHD